jgi:hypothetical protein
MAGFVYRPAIAIALGQGGSNKSRAAPADVALYQDYSGKAESRSMPDQTFRE